MNLDQLEVWKRAHDFAVMIYKQDIPLLQTSEKYSLADQLKRAATSIPANIAEGQGEKEFPGGYTVREETEIYAANEFEDSDY